MKFEQAKISDIARPPIEFLRCETPQAWIERALENLDVLLIDHANCEKKAASTALNLMYRYTENFQLLNKLSRLAREELRHFEQVVSILKKRDIDYVYVSASDYASGLMKHARKDEPYRLIDTLIIGGIIEARSCERFAALAPYLDDELGEFYVGLLKSEARHFSDYLALAKTAAEKVEDGYLDSRVGFFLELDKNLVLGSSKEFRFHSGV